MNRRSRQMVLSSTPLPRISSLGWRELPCQCEVLSPMKGCEVCMPTQRAPAYVVALLSIWSLSCDCNDGSCRGTGSIAGAPGLGGNPSMAHGGEIGGIATGGAAADAPHASTLVTITGSGGSTTAVGPSLITLGGVPSTVSLGLGGAVTSPAGGSVQTLGGSSSTVPIAIGGSTTMTVGSGSGGATSTSTISLPNAGADSTGTCLLGKTDLMLLAAASPTGRGISGDFTGGDDPCGFRGGFYAYSDQGVDGESGTADDSLTWPVLSGINERNNPCANGKCCIQGVTHLFPKLPDGTDDTMCCWGAGLTLDLASKLVNWGGTASATPSPYNGPARGFRIALEGDLSAGQQIHIAYTQSETDQYPPFVQFTSLGTKEVLFQDVSCASWATDCTETGFGGAHPYHLQVQVDGGDAEGSFRVCVTSLIPL